jgi:stage V sporulation protein SpoVS
MVDWVCRVEDGAATSGAVGATAIDAAQRAVAAWRQFVTGSGVELGLLDPVAGEEMEEGSKPPALQAPSSLGGAESKEEKRVS